jgi:predicted ATPase/DNA-binding CsgD family transcriptional regulator
LAPLVDREQDIAMVSSYLARDYVRLLSLVGPPGVGKSRLAFAAASVGQPLFADGVMCVDMVSVPGPGQIMVYLADCLGLGTPAQAPLERVSLALREKQLLLLLDNFEHLADEASCLVELLSACPRLKMLITTRATLRVSGEYVYQVEPLALRTTGVPHGLAQVEPAPGPSSELFIQRAQTVCHNLNLSDDSMSAIDELCRRLDGIPLAIELAAAQLRLFTPQALLARLVGPDGVVALDLLRDGPRDLPARQHTMRATIDSSHRLLSPNEQVLLRRLAVFAGNWTLAAAEAICGEAEGVRAPEQPRTAPASDPQAWVITGIAALVDKSLLRRVGELNGEPRFEMLNTIQAYALERLGESGERASLRQRHAAFYLRLAERSGALLPSRMPNHIYAWLEAERANLHAALQWSFERHDEQASGQLSKVLWRLAWERERSGCEQRAGTTIGRYAYDARSGAGGAETSEQLEHAPEPLTPREIAVLRELAKGLDNAGIGRRLSISKRTVDAHLFSIYGKLGVHSRAAAIRHAIGYQLI